LLLWSKFSWLLGLLLRIKLSLESEISPLSPRISLLLEVIPSEIFNYYLFIKCILTKWYFFSSKLRRVINTNNKK
jgi:hypothetical protein